MLVPHHQGRCPAGIGDTPRREFSEMKNAIQTTRSTRVVAQEWFDALLAGDVGAAGALLAPDVRFINHTRVPGVTDDMTWIGTHVGRQAALDSLGVFL